MSGVSGDYLNKHRQFRIKHKKLAVLFPLLAIFVAIIIFWWLKIIGITVTGESLCNLEEHIHNDECFTVELVCENGDEQTSGSVLISAEESSAAGLMQAESITENVNEETHIHKEECENKVLICFLPEHIHSPECFPDPSADTEKVNDWLKTFEDVEITNDVAENLIAIALTQKGYTESSLNYEFDSDGCRRGYTRYGEWYGNPYAKWNTLFVAFCINYANANDSDALESANAENMRYAFSEKRIYSEKDGYEPQRGDIIFFDADSDGKADRTAIVLSIGSDGLLTIEGDVGNAVDTVSYSDLSSVVGFGRTGELYAASYIPESQEETSLKDDEAVLQEKDDSFESIQITTPVMMFSTGVPQPNITYIEDLTLAIANVVFKTQEGEILDNSSTVYVGQSYVVSLEFKEDNTGDEWIQFQHNDAHILHYQIPEYLHCEPFDSWHPISAITENGTVEDVGEYFVDEHGYLRVRFFDDENGVCFGSRYSNVDFVIEFNATVGESQSGSITEIEFGNEIKVELNVDGGADMNVTKTHGTYDSDNHTMEYTIRVEATKGIVKELVIDDQIWDNHYTLRDTIVVTDLDGNVLDPQPTVSDHPSHNNGAEEGFRISDFPDFSAGNGFLITYKTQVYDYLLSNETVDMWNGLDSTGKDSNGSPVYKWSEDWLRVELERMEKEGKQFVLEDDDGNPVPVIEWEIAIQKNNNNLQGTVVIDTLGDGLEYYTGKDIRVKRYDQWGNRLSDAYISWDDVTVNGSQMTFTLPDGYGYDIVYYTTYEELAEGETKNYHNSVSAEINGREETAGGTADVVGFVPHVTKGASGNDGEYAYFTIEADVPAVIKDWGSFFLTDLAAFWGYDNDVGYLYVENKPEDIVVTALTESGQTITFTPYVEGGPIENTYILVSPAEGNQHHSFNILFNTADETLSSSKWILNEDAKLKISYKLPFDSKTGTEWEGELTGDLTLEDVLLQGKKMANEAYLNYTDVIRGVASTTYDYSPKIIKKSVVNEDGTIDYTVTFNNTIPGTGGNGGYVDGAVDKLWFNDTFDERLEYVPESLIVTGYSPWQQNLWLAKYKYTGIVTGNTINAYSRDLVFYDYNEEADQFGWNGLSGTSNFRNYYRWVNAGGQFVFTYKLRVKEEYLKTTEQNVFVFDNTAEITWDDNGSSGPVSEESEFKTGLLDKYVVQVNNKLEFDIHINRNALDILPGTDTLTIEDTMTQSLSVYWDSIKLLYEDKNGNWIDFDSADSIYSYTVTYDQASNKLTFVVPDSLHIRIDYTTLITENGFVSVNNSVRIDGKAQVSDIIDAIFKVEEHSGGASGSTHNITLLKQDGETDVRLPGVSFRLYGPMGDPHAVLPDGASSGIITDKNKTLYYIGTYTTGTDGTVVIDTQYLTLGGPYALVEVSPPEGYLPLDKPVYFYFYEPDPDGVIQTVTTIIAVENYTYGFVFPETGGTGIFPTAIIGISLMAFPILYSIIRRKRERRLL